MSTNDFLPFCSTDTGSNLESQADYLADPARLIGNQPGVASSKFVNKAARQSAFITSQLAQYISNINAADVLDNGNTSALLTLIQGAFNPYNFKTATTTFAATIKDYVKCSAAAPWALTLPTAVGWAGFSIIVKRTDNAPANAITIGTTSAQTIGDSGATSVHLMTIGEEWCFRSDGANWQVDYHKTETGWLTFTMGLSSTSGSPSFSTGVAVNKAFWKRRGQNMLVTFCYDSTGGTGGANGTGTFLFALPNSSVDTTIITVSTNLTIFGKGNMLGSGMVSTNSSNNNINIMAYDSTHVYANEGVSGGTWNSSSFAITTADNTHGAFKYEVPIANWES